MTRYAALALATLASTASLGCQPEDETAGEFRQGVPRQETITMAVPARAMAAPTGQGQALSSESSDTERATRALRGETAELYKTTRAVSGVVNGGAFFVGALVRAVVAHPPTLVSADEAVWGPWSEPLEPITWKVTIKKVAENTYEYRFEGQDKQNPAGPFVPVLWGTHSPARTEAGRRIEGYGEGRFTLDFDARNTLPLPGKDVGKAQYTYARVPAVSTKIEAKFLQVKDDEHPDRRVDLDYLYDARNGSGGSLEFLWTAPAAMRDEGGKLAVKSRWLESGAGRSDVRARGALDKDRATFSECWDAGFSSTFFRSSLPVGPGWGVEATDCVFPTAEYSAL
jgi:hypothetical protein